MHLEMNFLNFGIRNEYNIKDRHKIIAALGIGATTFMEKMTPNRADNFEPKHAFIRYYIAPYFKLAYAYTFAYHRSAKAYAQSHSYLKIQYQNYFQSMSSPFSQITTRTKLMYGLGGFIDQKQRWAYGIEAGVNVVSFPDYTNLYVLPLINFNFTYRLF